MSKSLLVGVAVLAGCAPAGRVADTVPVTDEVKADLFGTSPEFEQDLRECLEAHPIPVDHAPDHPASVPLAACVAGVYKAHGGAK
ncbi:hypothetical protein [Glutamicibacter nicotianae]|uniref:hypothetical protein n=1 Tax=Glutamicibacter nicotianae TaxID=37929 RepID=UPI00195AAABA|nr:hypothetical protein [Glutamicibacter nicotianae]MBM7767338.1 hypothetical protein [Glutamicibacter nicotianae]